MVTGAPAFPLAFVTQQPHALGQEVDLELLNAALPHLRPTFVDIGAEKGSFARFLIERGLRGVIFEPLPQHAEALAKLAGDGSRHFPFAIDRQDGQAEFHIACDDQGHPLDHFHSLQPLQNDPRVRHTKSLPVTCRSLASLHTEGILEREIGVLKIDTEGNDLRVVQGLGPVRADLMICEFFTEGIYSGWTEAQPMGLIAEAQKLGYPHWLAVRRRGAAEVVSWSPLAFTKQEWGNLLFFTPAVFNAAWPALSQVVAQCDERLFTSIEASHAPKRRSWFSRK
jgi:FkbM family methyltransferase